MNQDEKSGGGGDADEFEVDEPRAVPAVWPTETDVEPIVANMFMSQFTRDEFVVTFGRAFPPMPGAQSDSIPVHVLARIAMSPGRMKELRDVITVNYQRWAARMGNAESDEDDEKEAE